MQASISRVLGRHRSWRSGRCRAAATSGRSSRSVGLSVAVRRCTAAVPPARASGSSRVRVDELTRTRSGALDVQAAELRRIERDLHDGAQARLVALSMQLGRAEERLADQPESAALVRQAREEATAAIARAARPRARDRAAGAGRSRAWSRRSSRSRAARPRQRRGGGQLDHRLPAGGRDRGLLRRRRVADQRRQARARRAARASTLSRDGAMLVVEIADDGPGGADPRGERADRAAQRVEALDGRLEVHSVGP